MLQADKYIVRVAGDAQLPDIELYTDLTQGIAISVEGIAVPQERNSIARSAREIIQSTLRVFSLKTPKEVIHNTIVLLKRELADHFGNESKQRPVAVSAHTALIKFAWDEENSRVVAISDTNGGIKNYGFRKGKLALFNGEAGVKSGDIFLQCSPSVNTNLDWEVMQEILNFRNQHNLTLEQVRHLLIESAYNNLEKYRHTPIYEPRDMSVVLMEFDPKELGRPASKPSFADALRPSSETLHEVSELTGSSASGPCFEKPSFQVPEFDFSDLLLSETATQEDALLTLQKVRNRLVGLGYEAKIKPHHYADLPKRGNLQKVVKRAHDILEAEELREYLRKK